MKSTLAIAALSMLLAQPVLAQSAGQELPADLLKAIKGQIDQCRYAGGNPLPHPGFVTTGDINGDGRTDYLTDSARFECQGYPGYFCQQGGCDVALYLTGPEGLKRAWQGKGTQPRFEGNSFSYRDPSGATKRLNMR
ncbi:hypothetical protein [Paracoccus pacificus]|uniref:Uncharacterized protein n=1 Tax=Paracoccus pacificus TaxID=1463598 RepID=A0ABW4R838_9RHOB